MESREEGESNCEFWQALWLVVFFVRNCPGVEIVRWNSLVCSEGNEFGSALARERRDGPEVLIYVLHLTIPSSFSRWKPGFG